MFTRQREILKEKYKVATGTVLTVGHSIHDLFVNVMADLTDTIDDRLNAIESALTLNASVTHDQALPFAQRIGVDAVTLDGKSAVEVRIAVSSNETSVNIIAGDFFTTEAGLRFKAMYDYSFDSTMMTDQGGYYLCPPVRCEAELAGTVYNISAGLINYSERAITGLVYVTNPEPAYTLGTDGSSAEEITSLIKDSISNRSLTSIKGVSFFLRERFPGIISSILPIKKGDPEMIRDRIYDVSHSAVDTYVPRDFRGKRSGEVNVIKSVLYKGTANDVGTGKPVITWNAGVPTHIDSLPVVEATQEDYQALYANDMNTELLHEPGLIFEEDMADSANFVDRWFGGKNGSNVVNNQLGVMASLVNDKLVIGDIDADGVGNGNLGGSFVTKAAMAKTVGVIIKGTFETDDPGDKSRPLYITNFRRRSAVGGMDMLATDGYGIAIKVNKDSNGNPIVGPNLFITDNSSADQDMEIYGDKIIGDLGVETFVAATSMDIDVVANQVYSYELHYDGELVNEGGEMKMIVGLNVYIWAGEDDSFRPVEATLTHGSYTPINLRTSLWTTDGGTFDFDGIGMGVTSTNGYVWKMGGIKLIKVDNTYPVLLMGFDVENMLDGSAVLDLIATGSGFQSSIQQYGMSIKLLKDPDGTPLWVGPYSYSNVDGTLQNAQINFKMADYKSAANKVWALISSKYPAYYDVNRQFSANVSLRYVSIYPERPYMSSGEKLDMYMTLTPNSAYSPETSGSVTIASPGTSIDMSVSNGFNLPILRVTSIVVVDENGASLGITLVRNRDYVIVSSDDGLSGSVQDVKVIYLMPSATLYGRLQVNYRYAANISTMQALIDIDDRSGVSDIVVFHRRPKYINVAMSLNSVPATLETAIRQYIYEAQNRVESFDLVAIASNLGVDYGSISDMQLTSTMILPSGEVVVETSSDLISKTRTEIFIADAINLKTI